MIKALHLGLLTTHNISAVFVPTFAARTRYARLLSIFLWKIHLSDRKNRHKYELLALQR